jgi:hypothetical protein
MGNYGMYLIAVRGHKAAKARMKEIRKEERKEREEVAWAEFWQRAWAEI